MLNDAEGGMGHTHEPPRRTQTITQLIDAILAEEDDLDHILCCNVNEAVCGQNVTDVGFCVNDCTEHETCKECADILSDDTWICPDCRQGWWVD